LNTDLKSSRIIHLYSIHIINNTLPAFLHTLLLLILRQRSRCPDSLTSIPWMSNNSFHILTVLRKLILQIHILSLAVEGLRLRLPYKVFLCLKLHLGTICEKNPSGCEILTLEQFEIFKMAAIKTGFFTRFFKYHTKYAGYYIYIRWNIEACVISE